MAHEDTLRAGGPGPDQAAAGDAGLGAAPAHPGPGRPGADPSEDAAVDGEMAANEEVAAAANGGETAGQLPPPPLCPNGFIYTVQPGDTLFLIAQRFGVTLQALIAANPQITNPSLIFPGQQICVPVGGGPQVPTIECCMLLFRTANVPRGPEAGGVVRIFQSAAAGANVLVGTIDLPAPSTFGGATFIAWLRGVAPNGRTVKVPLVRTNPLLTPRVWAGSLAVPPGQQLAPFNDLIVTAELSPDVMQPSLNRIVLIGLFAQCQPQSLNGGTDLGPGGGGTGGQGGSGCCD